MTNYCINICIIVLLSCNDYRNQNNHLISHQDTETKKKGAENTHLDSGKWECIDRKDTLLPNTSYVKYVDLDSVLGIKICISNISEVLPYGFDCSTPDGLIPVLHSYYNNIICLKRGYSQNFREFIVYVLKNEKITVRTYEIALATDLPNNIVVYQNYDTLTQIVIENFETNNKNLLEIPEELITEVIINSEIKKNRILLEFSNGVKLNLKY